MKFPHAASIRGLDKNEPELWLMGVALRPSGSGFMCEAPIGTTRMLRGVVEESNIEWLDMPIDGAKEVDDV